LRSETPVVIPKLAHLHNRERRLLLRSGLRQAIGN
jgi:hypothetical protein